MQLQMTNETISYMNVLGAKITEDVVRGLSTTYKFSFEEAMRGLKVEIKEKKETKKKGSSIPLPFCGIICETDCQAVRLNHGLYTQCTNDIMKTIDGHSVCSTCANQILKNTNNMSVYGYISERLEKGNKYRDPKGKAPTNYGNVMEKLNISQNTAEREAANQGLTIPEEQFIVKKAARGRPKKDTTANDTSSEEDAPKEKKRGRPKKEKHIVTAPGDELIKELVENAGEITSEEEPEDLGTEENSETNVEVEKIVIKGKEYLISTENTLYDTEDWHEIGQYNRETGKIDIVDESE